MLTEWDQIIGLDIPRYWEKFWWGPKFMGFAVGTLADRFDAGAGYGADGTPGGSWEAWDPQWPVPEDPRQSSWNGMLLPRSGVVRATEEPDDAAVNVHSVTLGSFAAVEPEDGMLLIQHNLGSLSAEEEMDEASLRVLFIGILRGLEETDAVSISAVHYNAGDLSAEDEMDEMSIHAG